MTIAFCWSNDLIILAMLSTQNSKDESLSLVSRFILTGTVLPLNIGVQCLEKKKLHRFALSQKSLASLPSTRSDCINEILLPFTNMFSRWPNMFWELFSGN